jgi:lysophospholipase L1-like esterase
MREQERITGSISKYQFVSLTQHILKVNGCLRFIVVLALIVSLALNLILFIQGRQYYLELNETRLDPLGLRYYISDASQPIPIDPSKTTVVFFGDSRAADWPPPFDLERFEFINRGIGAQTSIQAVLRFDDHVKPVHPRIVILQVGINDLKAIPLFPEWKETIITNCKDNIRLIVTQSVDIGATVILTTVFPIGEVPLERKLFWSPEIALAVDEVNTYIRSLEAPNVIVFDTYSLLVNANDRRIRAEYAQDELHLNALGYATLNQELAHILAAFK